MSSFIEDTAEAEALFSGGVEKLCLLVSEIDDGHFQPSLGLHYEIGWISAGADGVLPPELVRQPGCKSFGYSRFRGEIGHRPNEI